MKDTTPPIEYSVIVPCYNTAAVLVELARRVDRTFKTMEVTYELVMVNDGSPNPHTWPTIQSICQENPNVVGVDLLRNFGQNSATLCGFQQARGAYVITMDDDLQHLPESIPLLCAEREHDIVIARLTGRQDRLSRQFTSWLKSHFDYLILKKPRHIRLSSFRLLKRIVAQHMLTIHTPNPFIPALMLQISRDIVNVPVEHQLRGEGQSNYTLRKRLRLFSLIVINNSSVILTGLTYAGVCIALASLLAGIFYSARQFLGGTPLPGWTSVFVAILFFGGVSMFSIGLIGEYLGRLMEIAKNHPRFIARHIIGKSRQAEEQDAN